VNYQNNEMLTAPNLSYTSRDFSSIFDELINSIPYLTNEWEPKDENDPGVVLLKMLSMLGDNLSYNLDKAALEAFPRTVLQRANAQQIYRLLAYKMHWWRSAQTEVKVINSNPFGFVIDRYNTWGTKNGITYTNINPCNIVSNSMESSGSSSAINKYELIQGIPVTPGLRGSIKPEDYNAEWHESYDYNVMASDVLNDKLYLKYTNIDESSITLIDNDEKAFALNEWKQVKNINTTENLDKVFEFDVDEEGQCYIQLPSYWKTKYVITKFKIFFVLSDGQNGEIEENTLININSQKVWSPENNVNINTALNQVTLYNTPSTYGFAPQTCTEARIDAEKYINTIDTLVTLKDFEKATMRIDDIANVIATDIQSDPYGEEMSNYQINLWIVRKSNFNNLGSSYIYAQQNDPIVDDLFKEDIVGELSSYKLMPYSLKVNLENQINWIDWSIRGQVFLRKPISIDKNYDLMVRINDNLKNRFNCETLDFNEPINYMDVIETVMKTDKNIYHVDLETANIEYSKVRRSKRGKPTGVKIKNKYMIYNGSHEYTGYYMTSLGCTDIEINHLNQFTDEYNNIYNGTSEEPGYLQGNDSDDILQTTTVLTPGTVNPGGSGFGKNMGNKIVREDGSGIVIGLNLGDPHNPYEYEIYNKRIWDWTGVVPHDTGYVINTSVQPYKIQKEVDNAGTITLEDTEYTLEFDSRMYLPDGSDSNRYLKDSIPCVLDSEGKPIIIPGVTDIIIPQLLDNYISPCICTCDGTCTCDVAVTNIVNAVPREVWYIYERVYETWTDQLIDKLTGLMFFKRGDSWYPCNRMYDPTTGDILDNFGDIEYAEGMSIQRDPACLEDVTGEYIQTYDIIDPVTKKELIEFEFFLGQDINKLPLNDSKGAVIEAYPIKPYSVYIYINGDEEILSDTGSGRIQGTPGVLNGFGNIDYSTGWVKFKLNEIPKAPLKIMYRVNKLTYANYITFDTNTFFVRPEYVKTEYRR